MKTAAWVLCAALIVAACGDDDDGARVVSGPRTIELHGGGSTAVVERDPFRVAFGGAALVAAGDPAGGVFYEREGVRHRLLRVVADRVDGDGVELDVETSEDEIARIQLRFDSPRTLAITFDLPRADSVAHLGARMESPAGEMIYGLSERLRDGPDLSADLEVDLEEAFPLEVGSLDRRGEVVRMRVRPTFAIYAPFYQTSRGYGLMVEGTALGEFDVASSDPEAIEFRFATGIAADSRRLRFRIVEGPGHAAILDEYTRLTGRPYVPPDWAFLHWRWRNELELGEPALLDGVEMNAQLVEDVTMYETLGIPAGVYLFDRPVLAGEFGFARFAWDEKRLPNPEVMIRALRDRGYHLAMWSGMWACGDGPDDIGTEANRLGYIAPNVVPGAPSHCDNFAGANFIIDVTHPDVPGWWSGKLAEFCAANEIQAIKLDRGEEHIPSEPSDVWADGRSGVEVRNAYPVIQAKIHHDAMHEVFGDDSLVISRSGYTGGQQWMIAWGGDTPGREAFGNGESTDLGLRAAIIKQQRAAFLGFPIWGSDTGGYYEFLDREVFARWIEFSAFSGIMEIGGFGAHAPWDMPSEPRFDVELVEIYRRYTTLRASMQPYLVELAGQAGETGMPMARPMVFEFPDDATVLDLWNQYMLGPELLVAPIWRSGERSRSVYLPAGTWTNYWDESQTIEGPTTIEVDAPLDVIPVYRRMFQR